jgi:hypothetical protein
VAPYLTPDIAERCRELHLPFLDTAGNVYLHEPGLFVFVKGQRTRSADIPGASIKPHMHVTMQVAGFAEALQTASLVQIASGLLIRVVSLPGLAMLKLLAWQERGLADPRDAIDFVTLCRHYTEAGNLERVYDGALPALQAVGV